jgi:hypothetical protein
LKYTISIPQPLRHTAFPSQPNRLHHPQQSWLLSNFTRTLNVSQGRSGLKSNRDPFVSSHPLITIYLPGSTSELDGRIITLQHWLSSNPYSHQEHFSYPLELTSARRHLHDLSKQDEDLDKIFLHLTETILLPRHPFLASPKHVPRCLFLLTRFLLLRFQRKGEPENLRYSIEYFRHLQHSDLPLEALDMPPNVVIMNLVEAPGARITLEVGSAAQIIAETVVLCRGFLTSDISEDHLAESIVVLGNAVHCALERRLGNTLYQVVEYMQEVIEICPPGYWMASIALARTLGDRFIQNRSIKGFREAIAILDDIIAHNALGGDRRNSAWLDALRLAASLANVRFYLYSNSENLEDAIPRVRTSLAYHSPGDEHHSSLVEILASLMGQRGEYFHLTGDPQTPRELPSVLHMNSPIHQSHLRERSRSAPWCRKKHGMFKRLASWTQSGSKFII